MTAGPTQLSARQLAAWDFWGRQSQNGEWRQQSSGQVTRVIETESEAQECTTAATWTTKMKPLHALAVSAAHPSFAFSLDYNYILLQSGHSRSASTAERERESFVSGCFEYLVLSLIHI